LGKFQPDIAAAENQQMFRDNVQLQRFHVSERRRLRQASYVADFGPRPSVDEDLFTLENPLSSPRKRDFQGPAGDKPTLLRAKLSTCNW
jgi:hypothetical protein